MATIDPSRAATDAELGLDILDNPPEVKEEVKEEVKPETKEEEVVEETVEDEQEPEDAEEEEEQVEEEKPAKKSKVDKRVPYNRFQEKNEELKEAKAELARERARYDAETKRLAAELEAKQAKEERKRAKEEAREAKPAINVDDLEEKYQELITNMEYDKAKSLRKEINSALMEQAEDRASKRAEKLIAERDQAYKAEQEAREAARLQKEFTKAAAEITKKYDFLDSKSENANNKAIRLFLMERDDLLESGMDPIDAFKAAAEAVAPLFGGEVEGSKKSTAAADRNKEAARKAEETSKRIPPSTAKAGIGAKNEEATGLPKNFKQRDWDKASEDERLRALGLK